MCVCVNYLFIGLFIYCSIYSPSSVQLGVLNAFLRCPPWSWMVRPPSQGLVWLVSQIVSLLVSLCWKLGRPESAHFFGRTSYRHSAFLCIFYHVRTCFVGLGWGRVGWGGANNVLWHSTCCYACTCGKASRVGWGGVERGGANNVSRHLTCCYACTCG